MIILQVQWTHVLMLLHLINVSKHITSASCYSDITLNMQIKIMNTNAKSYTVQYATMALGRYSYHVISSNDDATGPRFVVTLTSLNFKDEVDSEHKFVFRCIQST